MKRAHLLLLVTLSACSTPMDERNALNVTAHVRDVTPRLQIRALGGTITDVCTADNIGPNQGEAQTEEEAARCGERLSASIRSQSLDLRLELQDRGCEPTLIAIDVTQLPEDAVDTTKTTYRVFLDTLSPEVAAVQGVLAGGLGLTSDPHDGARTPIGLEEDFSLSLVPGEPEVRQFGVCLDRGRRSVEIGPLETLERTCTITNADSLCTTSGTESSAPLAAAGMLVRLRLRTPLPPGFTFATWGNTGGDPAVQNQILDSIKGCSASPRFAVISGDFTESGNRASFIEMTDNLDEKLAIPWFGTLGDKDVKGTANIGYLGVIGASSYAMDLDTIRLIVLDSADAGLSSGDHSNLQAWLGRAALWWAGDPSPPARLVITHVPPFDPIGVRGDAFRSRGEAARLVASLQRGAVDQVITSQWSPFAVRHTGSVKFVDGGGAGAPADGETAYWLLVEVDPDCPDERRPVCPGNADGAPCPCISVTPIPVSGEIPSVCREPPPTAGTD